jgi:Zn-dependent protease with chaperone function
MQGNWFKTTILMLFITALLDGVRPFLACALLKIRNYAHQITMNTEELHPEIAEIIINRLSDRSMHGLFNPHPQTEERVARHMEMVY